LKRVGRVDLGLLFFRDIAENRHNVRAMANSKDEIYSAVFDTLIRLDVQRGHMSWKISDLARLSKVSRPLIYYYFGKSKEKIMQTAIEFLGAEYFGLSDERLQFWKNGNVVESILKSRNLCLKAPYVPVFYLLRRGLDSDVGKALRDFEVRHQAKIRFFYPNISEDSIRAMSAVFFGLVAAPDLTEEGVRFSLKIVQARL
jgi:hypothetical protein